MPGNTFGRMLRITTFGESHGAAVGVIIDGVPAGLYLNEDDIAFELAFRKPGRLYVSGRREDDKPEILSGVFNGRTTGAPIAVIIRNTDAISKHYEEIRYKPRPGHADLPYIIRYGYENWDYRGGGRASARETVARVVGGAIAKKLLMLTNTWIAGHLKSLGPFEVSDCPSFEEILCSRTSPVRACRKDVEKIYEDLLMQAMKEGDSYGGIAEIVVKNPPEGLGEPVFDKIKADLAKAILSIPAVVGFEYGLGFRAARMKGSETSDEIIIRNGKPRWRNNYSGGILGGITTGEDIIIRCAFKPTSSIRKPQRTIDLRTMEETTISVIGRHDPAVAIRGVSVAEAMTALVIADHAIRSGVINPVRISSSEASEIEERWRRYREACGHSQGSQ